MCAKNTQLVAWEQLCRKMWGRVGATDAHMARELDIKGRRYWILSEPEAGGWKASVAEVLEDGSSEQVGIDAGGETRGAADDAAEWKRIGEKQSATAGPVREQPHRVLGPKALVTADASAPGGAPRSRPPATGAVQIDRTVH